MKTYEKSFFFLPIAQVVNNRNYEKMTFRQVAFKRFLPMFLALIVLWIGANDGLRYEVLVTTSISLLVGAIVLPTLRNASQILLFGGANFVAVAVYCVLVGNADVFSYIFRPMLIVFFTYRLFDELINFYDYNFYTNYEKTMVLKEITYGKINKVIPIVMIILSLVFAGLAKLDYEVQNEKDRQQKIQEHESYLAKQAKQKQEKIDRHLAFLDQRADKYKIPRFHRDERNLEVFKNINDYTPARLITGTRMIEVDENNEQIGKEYVWHKNNKELSKSFIKDNWWYVYATDKSGKMRYYKLISTRAR